MNFRDQIIQFLRDAVLERGEVDRFLDPDTPSWARFDSQLGYLPNDSVVPDNIDGALSEYRYGSLGERLQINHADRTTRINTYGDSFTQCHQVSDGETWQETLAAHLGEPLRNFGVGGFGVFHAVERLRRIEAGDGGVPYIVLNIYLDDHYRNLDGYRRLRVGDWFREYGQPLTTSMFHANPWEHVRIDPQSGELLRQENVCPTPASLYNLCDPEFLVDRFSEDLVVHKLVGDAVGDFSYLENHVALMETLGLRQQPHNGHVAQQLWERSAFRSTRLLLEQLMREIEATGKKLLVLLTYPSEVVVDFITSDRRPDQQVLDDLETLGIPYVDGLAIHARDFASFSTTPERYVERYYAGHYTPLGNAFYAFAIKSRLVEWLEPDPPMYRSTDDSFARFAGRLA